MTGVEWLPDRDETTPAVEEESLRAGSSRPPRGAAVGSWWNSLSRRARYGWVFALAVLVAGLGAGADLGATPAWSPPDPELLARQNALLAQVGGGLAAPELARISITGPSSSCRPAPPGNAATERIATAVTRRLSGFQVMDRNENFEAGSSLCAATLRLRDDATGVALEVIVETPPNPADGTVTAARAEATDLLGAVSSVTVDGWRVVIGARGPKTRLPSRAQLLALSLDPDLTW